MFFRPRLLLIALGEGLGWTFLSIFFGLLQIWIILLGAYVSTTSQFNYDKIMLDGVLLFFSSALVAAIAVEYFFSRRLLYKKRLEGLLFFLVPIIIIGTVGALYAFIYPTAPIDLSVRERITWLEIVIFAVSCLYAILIKSLTFFEERNLP